MENKYYTPSIEEFYVGFEFEEKSSGIWTKQIYDDISPILNQQICDDHGVPIDTMSEYIKQEIVRIKYLDKSDIEELGFKHIGALWFKDRLDDFRIRKWKGNQVDIYRWYSDNENHIIFKGCIKNKSELKKLLNQLGINA